MSSDSQSAIDVLNKTSYEERHHDPARSIEVAEQALQLSESAHYKKGKADALCNLGFSDMQYTKLEMALEKLLNAIQIYESIQEEEGKANALYNLGIVNIRLGIFETAIDALHRCLTYREQTGDLVGQASCFFQLSFINETFGDHETALELANRCLSIREQLKDRLGIAAVLMQIGAIWLRKKDFVKAKEVLEISLATRKPEDEVRGYFATLLRWTELHIELGELEKAKAFAKEGLEIATEANELYGVMRFLQTNGRLYFAMNEIAESLQYYHRALELSAKLNFKSVGYEIHQSLCESYKSKGDYKEALYHFEKFHSLKEEVLTNQSNTRLKSVQFMNQIDSARREAELARSKNEELQSAYFIIEEKNKSITDSITYAQRIQRALLASENVLKKNLPEYFVLYKPKDIVSGDFYWATETTGSDQAQEAGKKFYLAVCDCTGHGVPGAFMPLLNISFLNEAVNEKKIFKPNEIFNSVRTSIINALGNEREESQDGMDGICCAFDFHSNKIKFACANNPLLIVRKNQLLEFPADKMPVGKHHGETCSFNLQECDLQKGDIIYLMTDGYADQFGGPKGKKFKYKQLGEKLIAINDKELTEQKTILETTFENWRGNLEQVDDVLVIGIKI